MAPPKRPTSSPPAGNKPRDMTSTEATSIRSHIHLARGVCRVAFIAYVCYRLQQLLGGSLRPSELLAGVASELTGWWIPTKLLGLSDFRESPLYRFMFFNGALKKAVWGVAYWFMSKYYKNREWTCMNYGYADPTNADGASFELGTEQEKVERFQVQMYLQTASKAGSLKGKRVLEVGCGRGGGLVCVNGHHELKACTGLDYAQEQVDLCSERWAEPPTGSIGWVQGDAESLPFDDGSFDAVINVESSHCYPNIEKFFDEVQRVLKPGGVFSIADFRNASSGKMATLEAQLTSIEGMQLFETQDITPNAIRSCELDNDRRVELITRSVHPWLHAPFLTFSGVTDGDGGIYSEFVAGVCEYKIWALKKK